MPISKRDLLKSAPKITPSEKIMHVPGSIIGNRYQIIQKLGREEMSQTYLAKDLQATGDNRCAIEQLVPSYDNEINWQLIEQHLIKEVAVLERLGDHPQIPQFYNHFSENKHFYLVREYIDGDNLETIVERKIFDEADVVALIQDALRILNFIHKTNVIHRNVQPIHLIRRKQDNSFVLINFGAVREIESTEINLKGEVMGGNFVKYNAYIAPEQKAGQSHFSSDIYALGKSAVYALTGRSPQELDTTKIKWQDRCHISPKLKGILTKMVSPDLQERYSRILDVLRDLRPLLKIKQTVGARYTITHYLGGNGGIETYLADNLHRQYQSPCLIKQVELPSTRGAGNKIEKRFAEELSILERLGYDDRIPQIWDHFEENDEFYLVLEYIQGETLDQKILQQLTMGELLKILASSLSALSFIHQNRIIHRNIKPANLMIRYEDQQVIITDFGILRDIKTTPNLTIEANQDPDKLNYWAPEQIAGRPTMASDIYALGMSIIETLTGAKPATLPRDRQSGKLLWQQNLSIDRRLVKIIDKMVELDLGQRYQSAEKVLADLQKIDFSSQLVRPTPSLAIKKRSRYKISRPQPKISLVIGLLGVACLLGSVEFAFPIIRPLYYSYQGNKLFPEQPQAALNSFTKAIDLKPESAKAWIGRGDALRILEFYTQALQAYSEAARLDPNNWKIWQQQGNTLYYLDRYQEAITMYNRALELHKEDGAVYNYRGKALYKLQDYESALMMQDEALAIDRFDAEFLSDRASNLIALDRYFEALTMLNRVQVSEPYNMKLWQDKALILEALNRPQEADRVNREITNNYDQALQKYPNNENLWLSQGDFLVARQMYDQAIESYNQAIKLKPNFYQAWLAKGKALSSIGQNQEAIDALDKALEIRPQSYKALQAKASVYQQGDLNQAIATYDQAIALNSKYAPLWRDKGLALIQQGNYTQAIESLTKASQLAPQDAQTWVGLATALDAVGRDSQALSALDRALKLQPNDMDIWSLKGSIQTKNGQYNEACETYRQSRLINPNSSMIINSMQSLGCRMN